jgi:inner membrane protein
LERISRKKPETGKAGFAGSWKLQHLNRSFPQSWAGKAYNIHEDAVGVGLMNPVDNYVQSERIVKYALLVIGLVFTIFFFMEMLNGRSIHPLQYLLVGFALSLFYSLMVALSEHLAFVVAYWIAAGMTILLIGLYLKSVLGQLKLALFSGLSITAIYGFMYMLLLQEDYALLIGNIGLFVVLALVMYFSRKVQWGRV